MSLRLRLTLILGSAFILLWSSSCRSRSRRTARPRA